MNYSETISSQLHVKASQVEATIRLLDEGNTVPFIARYRKEMTGTLDDEQVRIVADEIVRLRVIDERRSAILKSIQEQGKLTGELNTALQAATLTALEDLYAPYKPKRRTRHDRPRDRAGRLGRAYLKQPLSQRSLEDIVKESYLNELVTTVEEALQGARDIVAETISDNANVRSMTREKALKFAKVIAEKVEDAVDEKRVYESYYAFECRVDRLQPHQILALNRGEKEGVLKVRVEMEDHDWRCHCAEFQEDILSPFSDQLSLAIEDSAGRLLLPAIERDVRRELTDKAEAHAISVFATNLRALLSQPPLTGQTVLGLDPGFRTGTKLAVVDPDRQPAGTGTHLPARTQK